MTTTPNPTPTSQILDAAADQFCPHCGVSNDLHDGLDSCAYAESKALALESMTRMFFGGSR